MYVSTSLASPASRVVVPRWRRFCCFDLLISRWRLWPQLRLILPVAVRPKRFFAPLLVLRLGIFRPLPMVAAARHARLRQSFIEKGCAARRRLKPRYIAARLGKRKAARRFSRRRRRAKGAPAIG